MCLIGPGHRQTALHRQTGRRHYTDRRADGTGRRALYSMLVYSIYGNNFRSLNKELLNCVRNFPRTLISDISPRTLTTVETSSFSLYFITHLHPVMETVYRKKGRLTKRASFMLILDVFLIYRIGPRLLDWCNFIGSAARFICCPAVRERVVSANVKNLGGNTRKPRSSNTACRKC